MNLSCGADSIGITIIFPQYVDVSQTEEIECRNLVFLPKSNGTYTLAFSADTATSFAPSSSTPIGASSPGACVARCTT